MSRSSRLKNLSDELQLLFDQNFSEEDAYNQVKGDARFDTVRLSKVTTMFKQFRSKPKRKKSIDSNVAELLRRSMQLCYFQSTTECDHKKNACLAFWSGESTDGRFFVTLDNPINENASNSDFKDFFGDKACRINFPISPKVGGGSTWLLTCETIFLIEHSEYDAQGTFSTFSLSLLELDLIDKKMQKIHTLSFEDHQRRFRFEKILFDSMDPMQFLLRYRHNDGSNTLKVGRVHDDEILLGDEIRHVDQDVGVGSWSLVGNTVYTFNPFTFADLSEDCIYVTRLDQGTQTSQINLDPLPGKFSIVGGEENPIGCFAMSRFYFAVQDKQTKLYTIIWTSCETREWKSINFCTRNSIMRIEFMINGCLLLIQTADNETKLVSGVHQVQKSFYRIPLKKPEKLTHLAWFSLLRSKRKIRNVDAYEEARKYLPFNSEIQCPFDE